MDWGKEREIAYQLLLEKQIWLGKINLIYYQLKWVWVVRNTDEY